MCVYVWRYSLRPANDRVYIPLCKCHYIRRYRYKSEKRFITTQFIYIILLCYYVGGRYYARKSTVKPRDAIRCVRGEFDDDRSFNNSLFGPHTTMILTGVIAVICLLVTKVRQTVVQSHYMNSFLPTTLIINAFFRSRNSAL